MITHLTSLSQPFTHHHSIKLICFASPQAFTLNRKGTLTQWKWKSLERHEKDKQAKQQENPFYVEEEEEESIDESDLFVPGKGMWSLVKKSQLRTEQKATVTSCAILPASSLLVIGYSLGIFSLYTLPDLQLIHTLSVTKGKINSIAINPSGDWIALGSEAFGQLLVWEWKSETCIFSLSSFFLFVF